MALLRAMFQGIFGQTIMGPVFPSSAAPEVGARLLEDGTVRKLEDGTTRYLESA